MKLYETLGKKKKLALHLHIIYVEYLFIFIKNV